MLTLTELGVPVNALAFVAVILQENRRTIDDRFPWRNNLNSPLFSILLKGLSDQIRVLRKLLEVTLYADDLVIYGTNRF